MTEDEVVARLRSGMTIGIGGWGSRRKPMSLVRAILRSDLRDLTIVAYGGPDVGLLCAAGKVKRLVYGFVSLDSIPLEPHFRAAREAGTVDVTEYDEGMLQWALYAASLRLPFLPTRAGLGSDVMRLNPELRTVTSPYADGEELLAVPALPLDAALVHLNRADAAGNAQFLGPDLYFDDLFATAAEHAYVSCERIVPTGELLAERRDRVAAHPPVDDRGRRGGAERRALHLLRARLRARRGVPARLRGGGRRPGEMGRVHGRVPERQRGGLPARGRRAGGSR